MGNRAKNIASFLGFLIVAATAVWSWYAAPPDPVLAKVMVLVRIGAIFLAIISVCLLSMAPVVRNNSSGVVRLLGELPIATLIFLGSCLILFLIAAAIDNHYKNWGDSVPEWFPWVYFPIAAILAFGIPSYFVYRDLKKRHDKR